MVLGFGRRLVEPVISVVEIGVHVAPVRGRSGGDSPRNPSAAGPAVLECLAH